MLDVSWWAATGSWTGEPALPLPDKKGARPQITASFRAGDGTVESLASRFDFKTHGWLRPRSMLLGTRVMIHARIDGGFSVFDPAREFPDRNLLRIPLYDAQAVAGQSSHALHLTKDQVWSGFEGRWTSAPARLTFRVPMFPSKKDVDASAAGADPLGGEASPLAGYETPDESRPASAAPTETQLEAESPGGSASGGHDPYAALRYRDYRLFVGGWIASIVGTQIQDVAIGWEIFKRLGSDVSKGSWALGWVGGVQALPVILLALPAGQLADRMERRKIVLCSALLAALCSFGLALVSFGNGGIGWLYVLLGLGAIAKAIGWPARTALLPQTVPNEVFSNAATWNSSAFQVASVVGPALGGLLVALGAKSAAFRHDGPGTWLAYCLDACCSLTFCVFLMVLRVRKRPRAAGSPRPTGLSSLWEGVRYVYKTQMILATITLDLFAVLLGGATFLLPVFAEKRLGVGAVGLGWLRAAPAVGALCMAVTMAHLPPMKRAGRAMLWAVAGFGAATIVFGLSRSFTLSLVMLALTGAFDNISVIVRHTLVQIMTPDRMRGRVSAVNNIFVGASNELGGFESGLTSGIWGPVVSVVGGGIGTIVVVIAAALAWPRMRELGALHDAAVEVEPTP